MGHGTGSGRGNNIATERATATQAAPAEEPSTTSLNKAPDQVQTEVAQLQGFPAGTQIEVKDGDTWVTYTAHDQARMGRNGRYLRRRVYSIVGAGNRNLPVSITSTTDPYFIAQGQWRKKQR